MDKWFRDFIRNYWLSISAIIILMLGMILDITGIRDFNISSLAWLQLFIIVTLLVVQTTKPQRELNQFRNSRPQISVKRVILRKNVPTTDFLFHANDESEHRYSGGTVSPELYKPYIRSVHGSTDGGITETVEQSFALIDFVNNPDIRRDVHNAERVIARVSFFDENGNDILGREIKGLWSQKIEPTRIISPQPEFEFTEIDIPANGDERTLCVAVKFKEESDCYAYNVESYVGGVFLKKTNMRLGNGIIRVKITLSGVYLDDSTFCFRLVNPGKDRDITFIEINCN